MDNNLKWYRYGYDALNRLESAIGSNTNYDLVNVDYDKMGNITALNRKGHTNSGATSFGSMDVLDYEYHNGDVSNRLYKVRDDGNDTYGFKDSSVDDQDYWYDANGNMTRDDNKGITAVEYNHLNMPTKITVTGGNAGTLDYVYAADRTKLRKIKTQGGSTTTTDYIGNYVYENGNLKQITQSEGYIEPDGGSWQYVYRYVDIWGNTRITYADDNGDGSVGSSEIRKEQNYYPFGMEHKGYNTSSYGVENNLMTYQGQEFTKDLGLNTHEWLFRMSDPATGRFWQTDPLADEYVYNSTYAFQENKMGLGVELEGLELRGMPPVIRQTGNNIAQSTQSKISEVYNKLPRNVQEGFDNSFEILDKYGEPTLKILAGVAAVAAAIPTGGTSLSALGALSAGGAMVSGTYAAGTGIAEIGLIATGQEEKAEEIPSGYLNATIGIMVENTVDDETVVETVNATLSIVEGVATYKFSDPSDIEKISNALSITVMMTDLAKDNQQNQNNTDCENECEQN